MAVVQTTSTVMADIASGRKTRGSLDRGRVLSTRGVVTVNASDSNTSTYTFVRLNSNYNLTRVFVSNDVLRAGTAGAPLASSYSIGLYNVTDGTTTAAFFAANLDLSAAKFNNDVRFTTLALSTGEYPLWRLAGETSDTGKVYDLVITANTAATVTGSLMVECFYTNN